MHDIVDDSRKERQQMLFQWLFFAFIQLEYICLYFHKENIVISSASLKNNKSTNRKEKKGNFYYMCAKTMFTNSVCVFSSFFYFTFIASSYHFLFPFFFRFFLLLKAPVFLYRYLSCIFIHRPQKTPFACQVNNRGSVGDGCRVERARTYAYIHTKKKTSEKEKTSMEAIYLKK